MPLVILSKSKIFFKKLLAELFIFGVGDAVDFTELARRKAAVLFEDAEKMKYSFKATLFGNF